MLTPHATHCPYCGEMIDLFIDVSVPDQHYTEDCQVCCRPMVVSVQVDETDVDGAPQVRVRAEHDA